MAWKSRINEPVRYAAYQHFKRTIQPSRVPSDILRKVAREALMLSGPSQWPSAGGAPNAFQQVHTSPVVPLTTPRRS